MPTTEYEWVDDENFEWVDTQGEEFVDQIVTQLVLGYVGHTALESVTVQRNIVSGTVIRLVGSVTVQRILTA
jgi:hypothetical protein